MKPSLLLLPLLLLAAAPLRAQSDLPRRSRDHGRLVLPELPEKSAPAQEAAPAPEPAASPRPAFWPEPGNRYEAAFREFEALGSPGEAQVRAALEQLRGMGLGARGTALKALDSPHAPTVLLAARLLEQVGEAEDAVRLVEVASGAGEPEAVAACLETALRLHGGWLPGRAVRLLEHPLKSVRGAAEARLERMAHHDHLIPLLQLVRFGRDADSRLRAVRVLALQSREPDARGALRAALMDPAVPVALAAAENLAGETRPEEIAFVRSQILETPPGPELGYLVWALLLQQQQSDRILVDGPLERKLRAALDEPDIFLSGVAAACLAEFGFRSERDGGFEYLDREVPHALVRAVGGGSFYPQYSRLLPLAEASLRRITGQDFGEDSPGRWLEWLVDNLDGFRAVRGSLKVAPGDEVRLLVGWRFESGWRWLGGPGNTGEQSGLRLLGKRGLEELVQALEAARLLDLPLLPGLHGHSEEPLLAEFEIAVGSRRKWLSFHGDEAAPWMAALRGSLERLYEDAAWQLVSAAEERRSFTLDHLAEWDGAPPEARLQLAAELTRGRVEAMGDRALQDWAGILARRSGVDAFWDEGLALEFLAAVRDRGASPEVAGAALRAALIRPDQALAGPLLDAVSGLAEPSRSDLLLAGLRRLGPGVCAQVIGDERAPVRVAAARALGTFGGAGVEALYAALDDANPLVVRMAARSLGTLGSPEALSHLIPKAAPPGAKEVRREALWALGELHAPGALETVYAGALDADPGVRLAAVMALGELPGAEADRAFQDLFPKYAGGPLEAPYIRALGARGAAVARRALRPHLEAPRETVARSAAVELGALGDPVAAPMLIGLLAKRPRDPEVLDGLAFTLCADFRHMEDPAGMYAEWWRERGREQPAAWLASSLRNLGLPVPAGLVAPPHELRPEQRRRLVEGLLELLESGPAHLRPALTYHLQRLTGLDGPAVRPRTPEALVRKTAEVWQGWLSAGSQG